LTFNLTLRAVTMGVCCGTVSEKSVVPRNCGPWNWRPPVKVTRYRSK